MTKDILLKIMPYAHDIDVLFPYLTEGMNTYEIITPLRENHFLAQLAHESGEFRYLKELASGAAYEGRKDLGNIVPGDGIRYKGRGLIQLTGRANYTAISGSLNVDFVSFPELLETPQYATLSACWFWDSRHLNIYADANDLIKITRRINGGLNGLAKREMYLERATMYNR
jgi:putative chitinase